MLQSEFFERTHITLTSEEYADVECLYNSVKMDKDKFCKYWVSEKKNPLFKELAESFVHEYKMHLADINQLQANAKAFRDELEHQKAQLEEKDRFHQEEMLRQSQKQGETLVELAKKIILAISDEKKVYDVIEEEFGIGFIIRTKHEAGIPLSEEEINYMVGKL